VETEKPTLFQAGIVRSTKPAAEIPVTMMPIFVDTKFKTDDTDVDSSFQMREPPVTTDSKPGKTALLPAVSSGWKIEWTLQGTGFVYLLAAQKAVGITGAGLYGTTASNTSNLGGKGTVAVAIDTRGSTTGGPITPAPTLTYSSGTKTITGAALKPIFGDETTSFALVNDIMTASFSVPSAMVVSGKPQTHAGITGYANFNLKYAPFSKDDTASAFWNGTTSALIGGTPEWIIRNGINDEPQNDLTIFDGNFEGAGNANNFNGTSWTGISNTTPNGNGGIRFEFKLVDDNPTDFPNYPGDELKITSGSYKPKAAPATGGTITFSAEGWTGGATAYYVIQDTQPNLWEITTILGSANSYTAGADRTGTISTDPNSKPIWLIVQQGVKVSNIKKIDTGGAGVLPENGIEDNW
jgi:hypothetical protein